MTGYKGVECQSLEKDEEEKPKTLLDFEDSDLILRCADAVFIRGKPLDKNEIKKPLSFICRNWNFKNKCCQARYNLLSSSKFPYVKFNVSDLKINCNGYSNASECIMFIDQYITELYIKQEREKLRTGIYFPIVDNQKNLL